MSLYGDYIKERLDIEILESDHAFATYRFPDPLTCYIIDIYVAPGGRHSYAATFLADEIARIAKERGCKTLIGSVVPSVNGSTLSVRVLLNYGFKVDSATNDFILFKKEIT